MLTVARRILRDSGELDEFDHTTYGDRIVSLVRTTNTEGRTRAISKATSHKAKLYGRYLSWSEGPLPSDYPSGVTGIAGERVLRASVRSGLAGVAPLGPPGDVAHLLDHELQGGSYDDAAVLNVTDDGTLLPILLAFEMKNVRRWLYPDDEEVHKFLYRSAALQQARPDALICPVLVCRRRHARTLNMGRDLGFYAIQTRQHFVLPTARIDIEKFEEVRLGLDFADLLLQQNASPRLVGVFDRSLRRDALQTARQWRNRGSRLLEHFDELRGDLGYTSRREAMTELREAVGHHGEQLDW